MFCLHCTFLPYLTFPACFMCRFSLQRHQGELFTMGYRLSRVLPTRPAGLGGTAGSSSKLKQFTFAPVETQGGFFKMAVEFQPSTTVHILEVRPGEGSESCRALTTALAG